MTNLELFNDFLNSFLGHYCEYEDCNIYGEYFKNKGFKLVCEDMNYNFELVLKEIEKHVGQYGFELTDQEYLSEK
jgi:hypothetical protein